MKIKVFYNSGLSRVYDNCKIEIRRPLRKVIRGSRKNIRLYQLPYLELIVFCRKFTRFINLNNVYSVEVLSNDE